MRPPHQRCAEALSHQMGKLHSEATRAQVMPELLPEQQLNVWLIIHHQNKQFHVRAPDAAERGRMIRNSVNPPGCVSTSIDPECCFTTMS